VELLRTPRVLLRRWQEDDLPAYFDIYSRDEVMRWLGPHPRRALTDLHEAGERLRRWHEREANLAVPYGFWALVPCTETDEREPPVGTVLLLPLVDAAGSTGEVEIGWHLHPNWQGRGLVTEAAAAVLGRANAVGRKRVLALTDLDNSASQSVAMHLGMADEGVTDRWFGLTRRQFVWSPMS
jgi:RimJ/RimL family protein N-acetyltransferase